jgi:heterodisulfide reductase subunit C
MPKNKPPTTFLSEIMNFPSLRKIRLCMQCGTCTGSCPIADKMEHTPSELIAMVRADQREEVLASSAPWQCLSCYICSERCPRKIKVADIIYALKRLSMKTNKASRHTPTPLLYRHFTRHIYRHGRISEFELMAGYYLQTNPLKAAANLPLAWQLLAHRPPSSGNPGLTAAGLKQVQTILNKTAAMRSSDEEI